MCSVRCLRIVRWYIYDPVKGDHVCVAPQCLLWCGVVCARNEDASLLMNLEQAFGECIPSREDIKREVGTYTATDTSAVGHVPFMDVHSL